MNAGSDFDQIAVAEARRPSVIHDLGVPGTVKAMTEKEILTSTISNSSEEGFDEPTADELHTLRRVSGKIPWQAYSIAFVELCERFSYYGTTAVFVNFIQRPLPPGSTTGAAGTDGQAGALNQGQRASTGLTTFNAFWAYTMPILGAYIADQYLGRIRTIQIAIFFAMIGHIILIVSALPSVIASPKTALGVFSLGLVVMGIGTGGFKSNISPLLGEQVTARRKKIITLKSGERVIQDPIVTVSRVFMYFYMMINVGALIGGIGMVYAEKYVGFWLAYLLPTIMFCFCPLVIFYCRNRYKTLPPTGSVLPTAFKLWSTALGKTWSWNPAQFRRNVKSGFWIHVKPSTYTTRPSWMTFDDAWVDQVARGVGACKVFLWYPLYWIAYNQMVNNLTSQSATMILNGVPNDIINNLNPLSLIIFIPLMDAFIYPALRKYRIPFTPIKRITIGFWLGSAAMISATVTQYYIYKLSPCGNQPSSCDINRPAPISVWVQTIPYVLIGFSEICASITGIEYAFTKAPQNMRSLVTSLYLFQNAFSSAIAQALVPLSTDPLLVWNYGIVAVLAFIGGCGFWWSHREQDSREDALNMLAESEFKGKREPDSETTS